MNAQKAEIVTYICKECQKQGLTLKDLREIFKAVERFYEQNARP